MKSALLRMQLIKAKVYNLFRSNSNPLPPLNANGPRTRQLNGSYRMQKSVGAPIEWIEPHGQLERDEYSP